MGKTKYELFDEAQRKMSDAELVELIQEKLSELCSTGGRSLEMNVPPKPTDFDMLTSELLRRYAELKTQVEK